jgi:endoglucanase
MKLFNRSNQWRFAAFSAVLAGTACSDSPMSSVDSTDASASVMGILEVASPADGATVSGATTFKARMTDRALTSYTMYWQVDGQARVQMTKTGGYDQTTVDVGGWPANTSGGYTIRFTAEQKVRGRATVVGSGTIVVYRAQTATEPPPVTPIPPASTNPFAGASFFVDPYSNAKRTAELWRATRPSDAAQMDKIAGTAQADWFGTWITDIQAAVNARVTTITATGALPVLVAYNIVRLDCGTHGAATPDAYKAWITSFANGIGNRRAVVVLEPDALAALGCLSATEQQTRMELIRFAVTTLKAKSGVSVYIDAGHSRWMSVATIVSRLKTAGIDMADGFSLNVSNYIASPELRTYGEQVSAQVGGKHFVIDTSRNGQGSNGEWCNATGRGLGTPSTANTGATLVDAFFWIKRPGESDGACNGGPVAGRWWEDSAVADEAHALGLARRSAVVVATAG